MYKMIGGDGREYGPVSAEQIRAWVKEGRVNFETLLQIEGSTAWQVLGKCPEFQDVRDPKLESTFQEDSEEPLLEPPAPEVLGEARGRSLNVIRCVGAGGSLLVHNLGLFCGASLLAWVVQMVLVSIPILGGLLSLGFYGILYGGLFMVFLNRLRGQPARVSDALNGFNLGVTQLVLVGLFTQVLSSFGLLFFFLPGIYLFIAWMFALPLVADRKLDFWAAMELSRLTVRRCWFRVATVAVIAFLPVFAVLFYSYYKTILETLAVLASGGVTVERLQHVMEGANSRALLQQVVFLFALPLGGGMLMQAYEDLFGATEADKQ